MARSTPVTIQGPNLVVSRAITHADAATTVAAVEIPAKSFVPPHGVTVYIAENWAGGTPSHDVGDGVVSDGWVPTANITEATAGTYSSITAAYAIEGKYYATADTIDVTVAASGTDGTTYIFVQYYDMSDLDVTAS